jgi:formylmethanofuran dehydrogenase subunit E
MKIKTPSKCEQCGRESNNLMTKRNYKNEMQWICTPCYYKFTGHEIEDKK